MADGHKIYLYAVIDAFADQIDHAQLVKNFGDTPARQKRYSPAIRLGDPEEKFIGSYVKRQNLTIRMSMHRFTRDERASERGPRIAKQQSR
jgi:hypothetical protein